MLVKSGSLTQVTVATSSGEAEYNALVRGAAEALGSKAVGRAWLGDAHRHHDQLGGSEIKGVPAEGWDGNAAAHRGIAVVGAEDRTTHRTRGTDALFFLVSRTYDQRTCVGSRAQWIK